MMEERRAKKQLLETKDGERKLSWVSIVATCVCALETTKTRHVAVLRICMTTEGLLVWMRTYSLISCQGERS